MKTRNDRTRRRRQERRGFTLMEVTLVLVILSIIGGMGVMMLLNAQKNAYVEAAKAKIGAYQGPLTQYALHVGEYPSNDDGLLALFEMPSNIPDPTDWKGPYINKRPELDPWGNEYIYEYPGPNNEATGGYDLWSWGPDKMANTDDDIGNWDTTE